MTNAHVAPEVRLADDHVALSLPPLGQLLTLRHTMLIPYSTIERVTLEPPARPHVFTILRLGTHAPGLFWGGTFWLDGERRFYCFSRDDERALILKLRGHPYDRIVLGVADAETVAAEIGKRIGKK
ncbi:MAG: hypothetical protein ACYDCK_14095 [Thermoplasmatota archaeon]